MKLNRTETISCKNRMETEKKSETETATKLVISGKTVSKLKVI